MHLPWQIIDWKLAWSDFETQSGSEERQYVELLFAESEVVGEMRHNKIIACSLYCKPGDSSQVWPRPTLGFVQDLVVRNGTRTWWNAYAKPFLQNLHQLAYVRPDTDVHIYLAADMDWMVKFLRLPQVVIHVMRHESLTACPGMMWRYLAHDIPGIQQVQHVDIEDCWSYPAWMNRLKEWSHSGLAVLRHVNPSEWDSIAPGILIYRPLSGGLWALRPQSDFSMTRACMAFAWLAIQNRIPTRLKHPTHGDVAMFGHHWPHYGSDETFLQHVVYPFLLERGVATNFYKSNSDCLFERDLAAAQAACPRAYVTCG